ncbi:MAG: FtsX-like permease family protein, partial [Ekhidna sp.]|nr:FtsX-like permease family protein [Ekhidna sp.]
HENVNVAELEEKIQALPPKWAAPTTERIFNQTFEEFTDGHSWKLELQPLANIYISEAPGSHPFGPSGNFLFVKIFAAIGILVLVLCAINFINLSTARSANRSKEVGVRKVLGSVRSQLIGQFTIESILYVFASTVFAFIVVYISMDWFNEITSKEMRLSTLFESSLAIGILVSFIVVLGILSGFYPAFYLSAFQPIKALKSQSSQGFKGTYLRNALVVFQFSISIALIICSSFVQKQMSFASKLDLGFDKHNVLHLHNIEQFGFETEKIKSSLSQVSGVQLVGKSFGVPPSIWSGDRYKAVEGNEQVIQFSNFRTEGDYLSLLGLEFLAGRNFDTSRPNDKYKIIVNETATKLLGWGDSQSYDKDSPIGKKIAIASGDEDQFEVIGVVKDFNINSIRDEINPLIILHHENDRVWDYGSGLAYFALKIDPSLNDTPQQLMGIIEQVETRLAAIDATVPFEFSFLDQDFENTFRYEQKMGMVLNLFTIMAMIIGCLGLFGLAAFSAEQRTKEMGIRKVLGASSSELVMKFSSEFTKLVVISIVIASPLAWYFMDLWLADFAFSTPLEWWVFAVAAAGAMMLAAMTVSYQAIATTNKNPAETLKDE